MQQPNESVPPQLALIRYRRLALALVLAPLTVAAALTVLSFLLAGMSETTRAGVLRATTESGLAMLVLCFGFTLSFGLAGTVTLVRLGQRRALPWASLGVVCGAVAGYLFATFAIGSVQLPVTVGFAFAGFAIMLLIRYFAGIQARPLGS